MNLLETLKNEKKDQGVAVTKPTTTKLVLTEDQSVAIDKIIKFLGTKTVVDNIGTDDGVVEYNHIFTLSGIAGSGKSTIIKEALKGRVGVIGATISHSAKEVLQEAMNIECLTIASLLGLKQNIDDDGNISFIAGRSNPNYPTPIEYSDIIIIDECSMIDDDIFAIINNKIKPSAKVIFLGDHNQLPPVQGITDSITFKYTKATLNKAVRYAGPIADLGIRIREEIAKCRDEDSAGSKNIINDWMHELGNDERVSNLNEDGSGYIFINTPTSILKISNGYFEGDDPESLRLIAYRNVSIGRINKAVRQRLYNQDKKLESIPQFMPGELLISDGGYTEIQSENREGNAINKPKAIIPNGKSLIIKNSELGEHFDIPCHKLEFTETLKNRGPINCVTDEDKITYNAKLRELKDIALEDKFQWKYVYAYKDRFAWFNYGYTLSSHKS